MNAKNSTQHDKATARPKYLWLTIDAIESCGLGGKNNRLEKACEKELQKAVNERDALEAVAKGGNDLANDVQLYFDALSGKNKEIEPEWRLEQVAKSLKIFQAQQSPLKQGLQDSNFGLAAIREKKS